MKGSVTGLLVRDDVLEWAVVRRVKDGFETGEVQRVTVAAAEPSAPAAVDAAPAESAAPAAAPDGAKGDSLAAAAEAEAEPAVWKELRARAASFKGVTAMGLTSSDVLLRVLRLPAVENEELAGMVQLQIDKISPFPVEDMVTSHEVLARQGEHVVAAVAAVRLDVLETLGRRLGALGVTPHRVDAAVFGWWRVLKDAGAIHAKGRQIVLVLDGAARDMIVCDDGVPLAFRSFPEAVDLSPETFAEEAAAEIGYTLMSIEMEHGGEAPGSIAVWSRNEQVGLAVAARLHQDYACEVGAHGLESKATAAEGVARRSLAEGAALDLTPAAWRQRERAQLFKRKILGATVVLVGAWLLGAAAIAGGVLWQEHKIRGLEADQKTWAKPAMETRDMRRRAVMIRRYMDTKDSALECLRELCTVLPAGIEMTSFTYRKGEQVKISGEAQTVEQVYGFKTSLDASALFKGASLQGPRLDSRTRKQVFDIDIQLEGGPRETGAP